MKIQCSFWTQQTIDQAQTTTFLDPSFTQISETFNSPLTPLTNSAHSLLHSCDLDCCLETSVVFEYYYYKFLSWQNKIAKEKILPLWLSSLKDPRCLLNIDLFLLIYANVGLARESFCKGRQTSEFTRARECSIRPLESTDLFPGHMRVKQTEWWHWSDSRTGFEIGAEDRSSHGAFTGWGPGRESERPH